MYLLRTWKLLLFPPNCNSLSCGISLTSRSCRQLVLNAAAILLTGTKKKNTATYLRCYHLFIGFQLNLGSSLRFYYLLLRDCVAWLLHILQISFSIIHRLESRLLRSLQSSHLTIIKSCLMSNGDWGDLVKSYLKTHVFFPLAFNCD